MGTDRVQPVGSRRPRVVPITVSFGAPITTGDRFDGVPSGKARRLLTDEVMDAIAGLSGQVRADAYNELPPEASGVAVGI